MSRSQSAKFTNIPEASAPPPPNEISNANENLNSTSSSPDQREFPEESAEMIRIKKIVGILIIVSFFLITTGFTMGILWPGWFQDIMKKELVLAPDSTSFKMWQETPVPMYLKIYLYNWTNSNEIGVNPTIKPHFVQMGPYVFREVDSKVNLKWNESNGTVTFQQKRVWHFVESLSKGSLSDKITNLNPIAATIKYTTRHMSGWKKTFIDKALKRLESIVITRTVNELLFKGFDDPLLKVAVDLNLTTIPFEKFAWFYARNKSDSYDGTFNMLTGKKNMYDMGIIKEWKYASTSPYYSKSCGEIFGTNGDFWPPLPNNKTVSVFSPDTCTTLSLKAAGTSEWLGLTGSKFISDEDMFDNGTRIESRKCYCEGVECQPSGTLNVSNCKFGAPAFMSLPHFYLADESYRQNISGMNPNRENHEFTLVVHPQTGIPMQVRAALQINFLVNPEPGLGYFEDLPKMYVPMLWFTQEVNLTSEYASQVKLLVILPPLGTGLLFSLGAIGILLVIISFYLYIRQKLKDEQNVNLLPKNRQNVDSDADIIHNGE